MRSPYQFTLSEVTHLSYGAYYTPEELKARLSANYVCEQDGLAPWG